MKIFTLTVIFFITTALFVRCDGFDKQKMLRMEYFVAEYEEKNQFKDLTTDLFCFNSNYCVNLESGQRGTEINPNSILDVVKTEINFFAALKIALNNNLNHVLVHLLLLYSPFGNSDAEIDFYILLLLPKLKLTDIDAFVNSLFEVDLRKDKIIFGFENIEISGKIGTFSIISISNFIQNLCNRPTEIYSTYNFYRNHFLNPQITKIITTLKFRVFCIVKDLLKAFDLINGNCETLNFDDEGIRALRILSHFDISNLSNESKNRIYSAFEYFFIKCRLTSGEGTSDIISSISSFSSTSDIVSASDIATFNNLFNADFNWNFRFEPFRESIFAVYGDEIIKPIFTLTISALKTFSSWSSTRISLKTYLKEIFSLNPFKFEPLKNYKLSQNLIVNILNYAMTEFSLNLFQIPLIIDVIIKEFGISQNWPTTRDLFRIQSLFDFEGNLKHSALWIISHFPIFSISITKEMINASSSSIFTDLFLSEHFLRPFNSQEQIWQFQERLLYFFNPKETLKILLKSPTANLSQITAILDTFRAESDFKLISKLSKEEQQERFVEINAVQIDKLRYFYLSVYKNKLDENGLNTLGPLYRTLIIKIIIAIESFE